MAVLGLRILVFESSTLENYCRLEGKLECSKFLASRDSGGGDWVG